MSTGEMENRNGAGPELRIDGSIAEIWLRRPQVHNRIEPADIWTLLKLFDDVDANPSIRVLLIRSSGKTFSSGFDLGVLNGTRTDVELRDGPGGDFEAMVNRLEDLSLPTVAVIEGDVYGGAIDLALACDFRVGIEGMKLRMSAASLGIHYYGSGLRRYVSRLGLTNAKRLFFFALPVSGEELERIGFLDQVVSREAVEDAVRAMYATLSERAPLAVGGMKRILNAIARGEYDTDAARASMLACERSSDIKEGVAAWTEKRKPMFQGQ